MFDGPDMGRLNLGPSSTVDDLEPCHGTGVMIRILYRRREGPVAKRTRDQLLDYPTVLLLRDVVIGLILFNPSKWHYFRFTPSQSPAMLRLRQTIDRRAEACPTAGFL